MGWLKAGFSVLIPVKDYQKNAYDTSLSIPLKKDLKKEIFIHCNFFDAIKYPDCIFAITNKYCILISVANSLIWE